MKRNILIVLFSLLLAVHILADCASDCADAYKAALDKCTEEYTKAMKQCSDVYNEACSAANIEKGNADAKCWDAYYEALEQYGAEREVAKEQCEDDFAECLRPFPKPLIATVLFGDVPSRILLPPNPNPNPRYEACRKAYETCIDDNEEFYDKDCALAKEGLDDCLEGADIVHDVAMEDAWVAVVACRVAAMATSVACIANAYNAYNACVAGCGG